MVICSTKSSAAARAVGVLLLLWATCIQGQLQGVNFQPEELASFNGTLDVVLNISMEFTLNETRYSPQYNGGPIGPTLRLKPGDLLIVTLNNDLEPSDGDEMDNLDFVQDPDSETDDPARVAMVYNRLSEVGTMHDPEEGFWGFSLQNIHFHGAQFPPSVEDLGNVTDGDEQMILEYQIPDDQPPGLFWYHPQVHGTVRSNGKQNLYCLFSCWKYTHKFMLCICVSSAGTI